MLISWLFIFSLLFLGNIIAKHSRIVRALNFPGSLVGGILGGIVLFALQRAFSVEIAIPEGPRDLLLVVFFICSGLVMTTASWKEAGRSLLSLSVLCTFFIVLQNIVGILCVLPFGLDALYGVMSGSVGYTGGLGSAVAWGREAAPLGASNAVEVGVISATLGLLISALVAGPYVAFVMKRDRLEGSIELGDASPSDPRMIAHTKALEERRFTETELVGAAILVVLALYLGDLLGGLLARVGLIFPRFLSAMIAGVVLSIAMEQTRLEIDRELIDKIGTICLNVFIVMTLSSLDLSKLQGAVGSVVLVAVAQTISTIVLVHLLVYRWFGKTYESLGIAGGFVGFLLGSFAVAMATVRNTESRYGPIHRAVLLVTLIGGAVSNVLNAFIILGFFKVLA